MICIFNVNIKMSITSRKNIKIFILNYEIYKNQKKVHERC